MKIASQLIVDLDNGNACLAYPAIKLDDHLGIKGENQMICRGGQMDPAC
jgi:hypothetical protein